MKWAIKNGQRILATPNNKAECPLCKKEVIAKCGLIKVWHWAHKSNKDCDNWYEPETQWHLEWKNKFPKEQQEVKVGKHRADIKIKDMVIELQNSNLSPKEIIERENYYKNMIWLLNGRKIAKNLELRKKNKSYITFRWKHPPKSWWKAKKPIYLDFGLGFFMIHVRKIYSNLPCGGWGHLLTREDFLKKIKEMNKK